MSAIPSFVFSGKKACTEADPDLFFDTTPQGIAEAQAICSTCPFVAECAEYGKGEEFGMFGGKVAGRDAAAKVRACRDCGSAAFSKRGPAVCGSCSKRGGAPRYAAA